MARTNTTLKAVKTWTLADRVKCINAGINIGDLPPLSHLRTKEQCYEQRGILQKRYDDLIALAPGKDGAILAAISRSNDRELPAQTGSCRHGQKCSGISRDYIAVAFNDTPHNQNQLLVLTREDAKSLRNLLTNSLGEI